MATLLIRILIEALGQVEALKAPEEENGQPALF
jgi:hypothetical protein